MKLKTLGHDTEFFIGFQDRHGMRRIISAIGRLGGTKEEPRAMGHGTIQEDNILAEIGTPPATSKKAWDEGIDLTLRHLNSELANRGLCGMYGISSFVLEDHVLAQPEAQLIGCEPDYNAWTLEVNNKPRFRKETKNLRTAGGHVHVGVDEKDPMKRALLIRYMDLLLGVPSLTYDSDNERRKLYGKAGAHRPKPYGVEYRTLSNFWVRESGYRCWVWDKVKKAVSLVDADPFGLMDVEGELAVDIQNAINNSDNALADKIMRGVNNV